MFRLHSNRNQADMARGLRARSGSNEDHTNRLEHKRREYDWLEYDRLEHKNAIA